MYPMSVTPRRDKTNRTPEDFEGKTPGDECRGPARMRKPAPGFAAFGEFLAGDPDLQVYRKFEALASRNLAYLQSELMALSDEIRRLDDADCQAAATRDEGWMEDQLPARCWEVLERKAAEGSGSEMQRMRLVKRLRLLMAEYQDALIRQSRVLALDAPLGRSRKALSGWFSHYRPLVGHSYDMYSDKHDLVALRTPPDQDRLTSMLQNSVGYWIQSERHRGHQWHSVTFFPEHIVGHIVAVLSVVLSAVLLVGAIVALYFAPTHEAALGLIAAFTTLFAASIGLLTNARKAEIYASTAA